MQNRNKPDIYPRSRSATLDMALFQNPTAEYRGAPLWSWNNRLDIPQLIRQIDVLKQMGLGGFHIHPRTGLETEYLGTEFMAAVCACVDKARDEKMLAWLYDEDRWPSGFAGGIVTQDERYRARKLRWTQKKNPDGILLGAYEIILENGFLAEYRRLDPENVDPAGTIWHAYLETDIPSAWFGNTAYVDTLNPAAIRRFLDVTHERYAIAVGDEFGRVIPAIFTDEPQFVYKDSFQSPDDRRDLLMPFTPDLFETYAATYGERMEDTLPELFWELPRGRVSRSRYRYHDHVCERFTAAFADQVGDWCSEHGIALTGHMMAEPTLQPQSICLGEAMRSYRAFGLPGIDMLCDQHEYTTAKQAQSAVRQFGCSGMTSELYGVTNWDFTFAGHKSQGDWQAALGVTVRVHHLAWVSMAGEAKRDYPASIGYQSPWYAEYPLVEDHFARVNTVLTRGTPLVRVGVIHPIESYWLCIGPLSQTNREREEREANFADLTNWLLSGMIDFDFITESLLPELCPDMDAIGPAFPVGEMRYDVILIPNLRTIRRTTLDRLERFAAAGGKVIVLGEMPTLIDAGPDQEASNARPFVTIPFSRVRTLDALEPCREVAAETLSGEPVDWLLHQVRIDVDRRYLFVCNARQAEQPEDPHAHSHPVGGTPPAAPIRLRLKGAWDLWELGTLTGETHHLASTVVSRGGDAWTQIERTLPRADSLLLELTPRAGSNLADLPTLPIWREVGRLSGPVPVILSEPNVLLLDQAQYRFDDGEWNEIDELLRIENVCRRHFGLPDKNGEIAQPWTDLSPAPSLGVLTLRFEVCSTVSVARPLLALEQPQDAKVTVNGERVDTSAAADCGYFVDEAIRTVQLPDIAPGVTIIELTRHFTRKTDVEWCYLLGDFGVKVTGSHVLLIEPVRELDWGDWTYQGLPFYAGNVTYHSSINPAQLEEEQLWLRVPFFTNPLLSVDLDGTNVGKLAFPPYRTLLPDTLPGGKVSIIAYGNRHNAFGALHNSNASLRWFGPSAWRSRGTEWSYEYQLRPMGILTAPMLESCSDEGNQ